MTATTILRPLDTTEWLEVRRRYFTASAAATLFDEHPFQTLADVAVTKLRAIESAASDAMERGHRLEDAVALWWSDDTGLAVIEPDVLHVNGVMLATLDRLVVGTNDALEVKTTSRIVNGPERYWWWQCQAQIHCAGLDRVHIAALDGTMTLKSFIIEPDPDAIDEMVRRAENVMALVEQGTLPVLPSYRNVCDLHPQGDANAAVELDDATAIVVAELADVRDELHRLGRLEDELKAEIGEVLGSAATGIHNGNPIITWRSMSRSRLDERALKTLRPDIAAEFTTSSSFRVMRVLR